MSDTNKINPKKDPSIPTPGIIGNIDSIVSDKEIVFKTLIGSMTAIEEPKTESIIPWVSGLSMHYWLLKKDNKDTQNPHFQDEIYFILEGSGKIKIGENTINIKKGDVIFVPAYKEHHFLHLDSDLRILIFFGPDYCGRDASRTSDSSGK